LTAAGDAPAILRRKDNALCGGHWTRYVVLGPRGAVNLTFGAPHHGLGHYGVDFGYHSPRPMYDGQEPEDKCEVLGEVQCFYDGSGLRADRYVGLFRDGNDEAIFAVLEADYASTYAARPPEEASDA
jgi:hypothetical protein